MTEQQYRVVADLSEGDDPQWPDVVPGDRYTAIARDLEMRSDDDQVVRIERPVPTTDEPEDEGDDLRTQVANLVPLSMVDGRDRRANVFEVADEIIPVVLASEHPSVPTREQIADEVTGIVIGSGYYSTTIHRDEALEVADAVLALIQKEDKK